MNKKITPATLSNNHMWKMNISRDAVVLINPGVRAGNQKPKTLLVKAKKALCEVPPVDTTYKMVGSKMVRIDKNS